jgi:(E)-4-hydroxy-3-methylbut-2-enyl-diphosphate synthase
LQKYGGPTVEAMVESTINMVKQIETLDFYNIVIAIKSSDVIQSIQSYTKISEMIDYPLHIGITESGTRLTGTIKSSIGIGTLLYMGIGDTLRVSLTGDPVDEVYVAREILKSLKLVSGGVEVISCPTCGRTDVDIISIAENIEKSVMNIKTDKKVKVAVMGCAVNGPGEAREADIGIAGGKGEFLLFVKGEILRKIPQDEVIDELLIEVNKLV